jgi:antitoxin VapB
MVDGTVEMAERSLNLKNVETYKLASRVARLTGESMTQAVTIALEERLSRIEPKSKRASLAQDLMDIGADCAKRLSSRTKRLDHGKLLYDERGLPR